MMLTMELPTVIVLMGVTGSGKSNFIRLATGLEGDDGPEVGDDLVSKTKSPQPFECLIDSKKFIFLDTPGFGDTYLGDSEILRSISQRLGDDYKQNHTVTGIIYLHRIKDERITNLQMRNLEMLKNLCGLEAFSNVVLTTTFWDDLLDTDKGSRREKQLLNSNDMWGYMTEQGSKNKRFLNTRESALAIAREAAGMEPVKLQIQIETVDNCLEIDETAAGIALDHELSKVKQDAQMALERALAERDKAHQAQLKEIMEKQAQEIEEHIRDLEHEQALLRTHNRDERRRLVQRFEDVILLEQRKTNRQMEEFTQRMELIEREKEEREAIVQQMLRDLKLKLEQKEAQVTAGNGEINPKEAEKLKKGQAEYNNAKNAADEWRKEQAKIDAELRQADSEYTNASEKGKQGLRQKLERLEERSKRLWEKHADRIIATVAAGAAVLGVLIAIAALA
jgi:energy-coupling factor transporter ATP-binding protein EcfA2